MTIEHSRVFVSNRSQAVRLPKAVAFPPDVQGRPTVTLFDHPWPCTEAERYWDPSLQGITRIGDMIEEIAMQLALKTDPPPVQEDAHGVLRIAGTRVTLDSLVELYDQGASAEEIALGFESLNLHEIQTVTRFAFERVDAGLPMPGVIEIVPGAGLGAAIDDLALAVESYDLGDLGGQVIFVPL